MGLENASLVQARDVAPHSFCPLQARSTQCIPSKICILEEHVSVPFTSENTDQSRAEGLNLFQTDRVCGIGMTVILLLLTNAQSVFSFFSLNTLYSIQI